MQVYLEGLEGEYAGKRIPLIGQTFTIGRASNNSMRLAATNISREHATIHFDGRVYSIRDRGSKHGTYVNNQKIEQVFLRDGDVIRLGASSFRFVQQAQANQPASTYAKREDDTGPLPPPSKNKSGFVIFLLVFLLLIAVGWGLFEYFKNSSSGRSVAINPQNGEIVNELPETNPVINEPTETADPAFGAIDDPFPESLPTSPVAAGTPIYYDGWSMFVSTEIDTRCENCWGITVVLTNLTEKQRVFRFVNSGVTAQDNLGNVYEPSNLSDWYDCQAYYHNVKNLDVDSQETVEIDGVLMGYNRCDRTTGLNAFAGLIPVDAKQLIIHFEDFGPFNNVDYVIDL